MESFFHSTLSAGGWQFHLRLKELTKMLETSTFKATGFGIRGAYILWSLAAWLVRCDRHSAD